ncbi:MAG TPA: hypothetical protein VMY41_01835 [Thermohalobaculum sp.]|nr:hypothetical protein [Thermohalobaculum sp.]
MHATIERWGKGLVALAVITAMTACTLGREPAYDAALAGEVTGLTSETLRLFQEFTPGVTGAIAAHAGTVRLMAQARGSAAPASGLALRAARLGANLSFIDKISPEAVDRLAAYQDATPAYMADFLRNLALLEAHDRAATGELGQRFSAYEAALTSHQRATEVYLEAFRLWQAGAGPQPAQPAPPPTAPIHGLDPIQIALRITALEDILRDALIYERNILNRNR